MWIQPGHLQYGLWESGALWQSGTITESAIDGTAVIDGKLEKNGQTWTVHIDLSQKQLSSSGLTPYFSNTGKTSCSIMYFLITESDYIYVQETVLASTATAGTSISHSAVP